MLTYIKLENFKSFSNFTFDLRSSNSKPKKLAFIYGENGSGKSNLALSLVFLKRTFNTIRNQATFKDFFSLNETEWLKLDDKTANTIKNGIKNDFFYSLDDLISANKMIDSSGSMSIKIGFKLNDKAGSYFVEFFNNVVIKEELRYVINEREGLYFSITKDVVSLMPSIFIDSSYRKELLEAIEKYWGKHTFLAIINDEYSMKNTNFIDARINRNFIIVFNWLMALSVLHKESARTTAHISTPAKILKELASGTVINENDEKLKNSEQFLNGIFSNLYSDIKSAYYVFKPVDDKYEFELYFKKIIDGKLIDVPFAIESAGTQNLINILPLLISYTFGATVFIDEIDSGIHDLLMLNLIKSLPNENFGQIIATSHNTSLLNHLNPENVYIINIDASGNKEINCITDYKERTQKNNSMQKKYLRGDYSGIPYADDFDITEMITDSFGTLNDSEPLTRGI